MIRPESSPSSPVGKDTHETHPKIALSLIDPNPYRRFDINPLDTKKVEELRTSIQATGFWDNILVRALDGRYQLAYGHHRLEAARQELGSDTTVRAILREFTDEQMLRAMLDENRATVILTGRSIIEAVAAARLHFKTDENLRENISNLLNCSKERVKDALSILYAIEEKKLSPLVLKYKSLSRMTKFREAVVQRPNATLERQEKFLSDYPECDAVDEISREKFSESEILDVWKWTRSFQGLGQTQHAIQSALETKATGRTQKQREQEAREKEREEQTWSIAREPAKKTEQVVVPKPESPREIVNYKAEKRDRNRQRFEQVNKIIEAGVAALQQKGEFTSETQAALAWLRKVNTPPTPKVSVTAPNTPEPTVTAPEVTPAPRGCYAWTPEEEAEIARLQETEGLSRPEAIRKMRAAVKA